MKIAITGANGFLGSHLVNACLQAGHEVWALVRSGANTSRLPDSSKLMILTVDYNDRLGLNHRFSEHEKKFGSWDFVIHNAGLTVSTLRDEYFEVNVGLSSTVVNAIHSSKVLASDGKLIYISSYAAYGPSGVNHPISSYGKSKLAAEQQFIESGYDYMICRPTGIYGSGDMAFLPLFRAASFGIYPMMAPKNQKLTLIHGADLASGIVQNLHNREHFLHFDDGQKYSHEDFKNALANAVGKKIRSLAIPISLVKSWLKFSDWFHKTIHDRPGVTLEKYKEISQDWNLQETTDLYHPPIDCHYNLTTGCKETFDFYKKHKLVQWP